MVNINIRVDTPNGGGGSGDCENLLQMAINRKPLEESQPASSALSEAGSEMNSLQRIAVCRINNGGSTLGRTSGLEQEKRVRREIANSNERRRMQSINAGFQSLRALLPRKDGEKMSKASILQQTADLLKQLQQEKAVLSQQNVLYKQRLEMIGETSVRQQSPSARLLEPGNEKPQRSSGLIAPPKKRKFEFVNESSDEGFGAMSDVEMAKISSPLPHNNIHNSGSVEKPKWEVDVLENELTKLRLALDQETRMRLLLEDQLRAVELELSRLQTIGRLSAVPSLVEYSSLAGTPTIFSTSRPLTTTAAILIPKGDRISHQLPTTTSSSSTNVAGLHGSFTAGPVAEGVSLIPASSSLPLSNSQNSCLESPNLRALPNPMDGIRNHHLTNNSASSKQSLHAIVEAIRHLEGDQLFVDDTSKDRVLGCIEQRTDSGISSPVSERLLNAPDSRSAIVMTSLQ